MRETYPLTTESLSVIKDNVQAIAREMDVVENYLHQILAGNASDCFAKFRRLYAACVRAGVDVAPWDEAFHAIKTRHCVSRPDATICNTLAEKIARDADTTAKAVDALRDGEIDESERPLLRRAIQKERDSLDVLEAQLELTETVPSMRQWARSKVASKNGGKQ